VPMAGKTCLCPPGRVTVVGDAEVEFPVGPNVSTYCGQDRMPGEFVVAGGTALIPFPISIPETPVCACPDVLRGFSVPRKLGHRSRG
jgi:hypothetical protein